MVYGAAVRYLTAPEACPRDIKVTKAISEVKQAITTGNLDVVEVIDEEKTSSS